MNGNILEKKSRLLELINQVVAIMNREGERNWIRNFIYMAELISHTDYLAQEKWCDLKVEILRIYLGMYKGMGAFSDFHIWREDFGERVRENDYFSGILEDIETILESPAMVRT